MILKWIDFYHTHANLANLHVMVDFIRMGLVELAARNAKR